MKRLILFSLSLIPLFATAQTQRKSYNTAYAGIMLHDLKQPGVSIVGNWGINKFIGVGAGIDATGYDVYGGNDNKIMIPVYADVRFRFPVKNITPFVVGQFGKQLYSHKGDRYVDTNGQIIGDQQVDGKYFFGAGAGISFKLPNSRIGIFASYIQRSYKFLYEQPSYPKYETDHSVGVINAGITF